MEAHLQPRVPLFAEGVVKKLEWLKVFGDIVDAPVFEAKADHTQFIDRRLWVAQQDADTQTRVTYYRSL
ncbi:MAG: hypothetical protein OHK0039_47020 [Bacteroidia bacterium]